MKLGRSFTSSLFASMLAFVGTFAVTTPTCLGWFYEPKKPEGLMCDIKRNGDYHNVL